MNDETPIVEVTIAATADTVWDAMRDKQKITHWHGWEFDGLESEVDLIYYQETVESDDHRTLTLGHGDRFELIPEGDRTRVRLTRAPMSGDREWDAFYDDVTEGWVTFLHQLKFALEVHPGERRRTLFYSGYGDPPDPSEIVDGERWFTSEHQVGLRVPAWGDGLLVTAHNPDKGTAMAVLTTYGLSDDDLAAIDATWKPWWTERYADAPG